MEQTDDGDREFDAWLESEKAYLRDADENGWIEYVEHTIWEDGGWVLDWMLDQPQCTKQVAAAIIWSTSPEFGAGQELQGESYFDPAVRVDDMVLEKALRLWRKGQFRRGEAHYIGRGGEYRQLITKFPGKDDPLSMPEDLLDGFLSTSQEEQSRADARTKKQTSETPHEPQYVLGLSIMVLSVIALIGIAWAKGWI